MEIKIQKEENPPKLVTFAATCCVEYSKCHSSGNHNGSPEKFFEPYHWWAHDYLSQRDPADFEGCPWIDKRAAVQTIEGVKLAISGPMVGVDLSDDEIERCPEPSSLMVATAHPINQSMLAIHHVTKAANPYGSLDYVCIREFMRLWQSVGAKVGYIRNGQFVEEQP